MGILKDMTRDSRIAVEFARRVEDNQPYRLMDVKAYLTHRCNLRCAMCSSWHDQGSHDELSTDEWMGVIAQARPLGLTHLKLFGGEPLLRRDVQDIVEHASGLGVRCTLITNGTLLTAERAFSLVRAGLAQLDLSLDAGEPDLHDRIRGVPGAWNRAVQGLQWIRQAADSLKRRVVIRVNAVVMRQNYSGIPRLVDALSTLAVNEIVLNPVIPQGSDCPEYVLLPEDILGYNTEVAPRIAEQIRARRPSENDDGVYIYGTSAQDIERASRGWYVDRLRVQRCFKPWYYMIIRENGDAVGCNTVKHAMARMGNVRHMTVQEIWLSARYQAFRASCKPPQFEECAHCCYHFALVNKRMDAILAEVMSQTSAP